jgi:hypothetical protein
LLRLPEVKLVPDKYLAFLLHKISIRGGPNV